MVAMQTEDHVLSWVSPVTDSIVCPVCPPAIQQVIIGEEVPSQQQEWGPSLNQQDLKTPHIKEEQEQPWISEEGERFLYPLVSVKSEEDAVIVQGSGEGQRVGGSVEQVETKTEEEDCGGSEAAPSLRVLVKQRLTEAVEEILDLFETTSAEYEEEIYHLHTLLEHRKPAPLNHRAGLWTQVIWGVQNWSTFKLFYYVTQIKSVTTTRLW